MGSAQRRIGPFNLGWYGILSSIINGCNLIITQLIIPKLHFYFGFQLFPIFFFLFSIISYSIIYPFLLVILVSLIKGIAGFMSFIFIYLIQIYEFYIYLFNSNLWVLLKYGILLYILFYALYNWLFLFILFILYSISCSILLYFHFLN